MSAAPQIKELFKYKVSFLKGPLSGQSVAFEKPVIQIGRGTENDLVLTNDLRASRQHAEIRWDGQELKIINTSAKNFVAVDGSKVESAVLQNGSVVLVGESEFKVEYSGATASANALEEPKTKLIVVEVNSQAPRPFSEAQPPFLQQTAASAVPTPSPSAMPSRPMAMGGPMGGPVGGGYAQPQRSRPRTVSSQGSGLSNPKVRFYVIVGVVLGLFVWFLNSDGPKKKELSFRSTEQIEKDIEASREEIKSFEARRERLDNVQFKRAQENYIRGFRDYKQGNYGRARESFQVVLNLDPDNELAKRYYHLSKVKFDEMVKFHMLQGNRYREKKNWRMCRSSYFNVMTMVNNSQDPLFKEAKQFLEQCTLAQQGTY